MKWLLFAFILLLTALLNVTFPSGKVFWSWCGGFSYALVWAHFYAAA